MTSSRTNTTRFLLVVLLFAGLTPQICSAQQNRRRAFVEGLLKTFIESQLPSQPQPQPRPANPRPTNTNQRPIISQPPASASPQMRKAGQLLAQASNEMAGLVGAMQGDIYRAQGVRQLLTLAMKVNGDAAVLSRRLSRASDVESLRAPLRQLNQDWATLDYRLSLIPNLSRETLGHIAKIKRYEADLSSMFAVTKQVDAASIAEQAIRMNTSLRSMLEDIRFEISDRATATRLTQQGRDTYDSLQRFIQTSRSLNVTYEQLTRDFQTVEKDWVRYERRLRNVNNRFVQRQVQSINDSVRTMHELLYLAVGQVDRQDLRHSIGLLQRDTDQLLKQINLKMLTELPAARRFAIDAAADFSTSCIDVMEVVDAGDDIDVIRDMYMYMHDEWERLSLSLQGVSSQRAHQSMRDIEQSLHETQALLGIQFDLDRREAIELAVNLSSGARHLQEDIRDFFGRPNRYPQNFQTSSLQSVANFQAAARELQTRLANGEKLQQLKASCDNMSNSWESLNQFLPRFNSAERAHLDKIRREVTPQVVQMQMMLAL